MAVKQNNLYYPVSGIVFLITAVCFWLSYYGTLADLFRTVSAAEFLVIFLSVAAVHVLRAFRQYLVLYGSRVHPATFAKTYCAVTAVSILIPFKLGDFYRAYSFGHMMQNYSHGIVSVLVDRFVDTLAVVLLMTFLHLLGGMGFAWVIYLLCLFLAVCLLAYWIFPGMYQYWKEYFLHAKATRRHNAILNLLDAANRLYNQIHSLVRGKFTILYSLSLAAWAVEIGGFLLASYLSGGQLPERLLQAVSTYFSAALFGADSEFLARFVCVSLACLLLTALPLLVFGHRKGRKMQCTY